MTKVEVKRRSWPECQGQKSKWNADPWRNCICQGKPDRIEDPDRSVRSVMGKR